MAAVGWRLWRDLFRICISNAATTSPTATDGLRRLGRAATAGRGGGGEETGGGLSEEDWIRRLRSIFYIFVVLSACLLAFIDGQTS